MTAISRIKTLSFNTGLSRSAIYSKLRFNPKRPNCFDPTFPKPIKLGNRAVGWFTEEVDAWLKLQKEKALANDAGVSVGTGGEK